MESVSYLCLGFAAFTLLVVAFAIGMQLLVGKAEETPAERAANQEGPPAPAYQVYSSMFTLVGVAVFKTQITAALFSSSDYPIAFSMISCVVICVMLMPTFAVFPSQWQMPSLQMLFPDLLIVVAFTALDLGFSHIALAELSTALCQIIETCNPAVTAIIETVYLGKVQHWAVYVTVLGLVLGTAFATTGSTGFDKFSTYGIIAASIQVSCSASKYVFAHGILKRHKGTISSLSLLFWLDFFMIPIYIPWVSANGEFAALFVAEVHSSAEWANIFFTSVVGGVRALTQFIVLSYVTATSLSSVDTFTQILNILVSLLIHHAHPTQSLVIGICLTLCSSGGYYVLKNFPSAIPSIDQSCPMCAGARKSAEAVK